MIFCDFFPESFRFTKFELLNSGRGLSAGVYRTHIKDIFGNVSQWFSVYATVLISSFICLGVLTAPHEVDWIGL